MAKTISELEQQFSRLQEAIVQQQSQIGEILELIQEPGRTCNKELESNLVAVIKRLDDLENRLTVNLLD